MATTEVASTKRKRWSGISICKRIKTNAYEAGYLAGKRAVHNAIYLMKIVTLELDPDVSAPMRVKRAVAFAEACGSAEIDLSVHASLLENWIDSCANVRQVDYCAWRDFRALLYILVNWPGGVAPRWASTDEADALWRDAIVRRAVNAKATVVVDCLMNLNLYFEDDNEKKWFTACPEGNSALMVVLESNLTREQINRYASFIIRRASPDYLRHQSIYRADAISFAVTRLNLRTIRYLLKHEPRGFFERVCCDGAYYDYGDLVPADDDLKRERSQAKRKLKEAEESVIEAGKRMQPSTVQKDRHAEALKEYDELKDIHLMSDVVTHTLKNMALLRDSYYEHLPRIIRAAIDATLPPVLHNIVLMYAAAPALPTK